MRHAPERVRQLVRLREYLRIQVAHLAAGAFCARPSSLWMAFGYSAWQIAARPTPHVITRLQPPKAKPLNYRHSRQLGQNSMSFFRLAIAMPGENLRRLPRGLPDLSYSVS